LITLLAVGLALAGLALIVGGFFIWRAITVKRLKEQLAEIQNNKEEQPLDEISSDSED